MKLEDYIENLTNDAYAVSEMDQVSLEEAFLTIIADKLVENETLSDYKVGYFKKKGRKNRNIQINGYSYEDSDGTYNLFIVDELDNSDEMLTNTKIDSLIKGCEELVFCGIEDKYREWEESSVGYEVASQIKLLFENKTNPNIELDIKKVKVLILTNKSLSNRFKNTKRNRIHEIPVEYTIYDASNLYDMAKVGFRKEPVDITLAEFDIEGIEYIKCITKENEFESFLAPIPGELLANIYLEHGSQILEGNVRSFLSVRGKVNKGIRKTILSEPEKFFILNNGITVTSKRIEIQDNLITKIYDLQIVNGGQTTASLANSILKDKADLSKIMVMMKLSVIKTEEQMETLVPEISRASNSQNKVDEADFFSNHPFHIKIEELSKKILAPATDGNQHQTTWFYERTRGQYTVAQMKLTPSHAKKFQMKNPKSQVIKKTDLSKYLMTYEGLPHETSKGAQAVMRKFSLKVQGNDSEEGFWEKNSSLVNESYFKDLIAKAILFKQTERLVSSSRWYKEIKAYRANIVAYSIAILINYARKQKLEVDLDKIWQHQKIYTELSNQLEVTTKETYEFLTGEREVQNVTEWAKREKCWKKAKIETWTILPEFENTLITRNKPHKNEVNEAAIDSMKFVIDRNQKFWQDLKSWGKKYLYLNTKDESYLDAAIKIQTHGKIPSDRQFKEIVRVYNMLIANGYEE